MAQYQVELYNSQNATQTLVADITSLVNNLRYRVPLNNFEEITFSINLEAWKAYCIRIGIDPYISLRPYTAEIKLKRNGEYLPFVCEIKRSPKRYTVEGSTIEVSARGVLSKLGDALITKDYDGQWATDIARDIITTRQAKTYGDLGITFGDSFLTGDNSTRTYVRYNGMDAIRNLSDDASGGFDFYFGHDWQFYTMLQRGSFKDSLTYTFGGDTSNVIDFYNPEDGTVVANQVTIVGEGIGDPLTSVATDAVSATEFGLREVALVFSDISNTDWLDRRANRELADRKDLFDLPNIVVSGTVFDLETTFVGDTIPISCTDLASPYTGNGRIKSINVAVDEQHHEIITLECIKV